MIVVRTEQPGDMDAIHAVLAASFPTDAEARLVRLLRAAGSLSVSLVADAGGVVVGHVAFSPVSLATGAVGIGLAPVAVLPSHRRQGIAAQLIEAGLVACSSAGYRWAVVLGDPAYYARFGFRPASSIGLCDEYGGGSAFQATELIPGGLPFGQVWYGTPRNLRRWNDSAHCHGSFGMQCRCASVASPLEPHCKCRETPPEDDTSLCPPQKLIHLSAIGCRAAKLFDDAAVLAFDQRADH
jgi:putative acetyltransferase